MNSTLTYASCELSKYFKEVTTENHSILLKIENFLEDDFLDGFKIAVNRGEGLIVGNNARSVLQGVYRLFTELGVVFLRPTKNGEKLIRTSKENVNVNITHIPSYKHRGITLEGACSPQNLLDMIEWLPKVGMNSYFIQFFNGFEFYKRWFSHASNPYLQKEKFQSKDSDLFNKKLIAEIKKRQLIYHAVGHGWTAKAIDLDVNGWAKQDNNLDDDKKNMLALVNGKREFFEGIPLNTQLCYSNSEVQDRLVNSIVDYLKSNKKVDVLHFWLADNYNNVCECKECQKQSFSDWYVIILNKLDKKLTEENINTKIVFLIYYELLWAPKNQKIINENRFILMFAPLLRSFVKPLICKNDNKKTDYEYKLNKFVYPNDNKFYLNHLAEWKASFKGDSFDFDYHQMWDIYREYSGERLSKVIFEDIKGLKDLKLNGLISCQLQRCFFPNGINMYVLTQLLNDTDLDFEKLKTQYYTSAFGKNCNLAKAIYKNISMLGGFEYIREGQGDKQKVVSDYRILISNIKQFIGQINNIKVEDEFEKRNFSILKFLLEFLEKLLPALIQDALNEGENSLKLKDIALDFYNQRELDFQTEIDGFYLNFLTNEFFSKSKKPTTFI